MNFAGKMKEKPSAPSLPVESVKPIGDPFGSGYLSSDGPKSATLTGVTNGHSILAEEPIKNKYEKQTMRGIWEQRNLEDEQQDVKLYVFCLRLH